MTQEQHNGEHMSKREILEVGVSLFVCVVIITALVGGFHHALMMFGVKP